MKEENNGGSKKKWTRIFRKKWLFPALYLAIAALLISVVVWYQNVGNQVPDAKDGEETTDTYTPNPYDEDAQSVIGQQEIIKMPVKDQKQAEIVTKFYDYNADDEDQESALVLYNNRYYQSTGVDIASSDGETFDVTASLSGTVSEVKEDPLLGNVVVLSHEDNVMTYYASLGEVSVQDGDKVKQGDTLGTAGKNLFGKDSGVHVHFELRKDGKEVNPEAFFNQPLSELDKAVSDNQEDDADKAEDSDMTDEEGTEQPDMDEEQPDQDKEQEQDAGDENKAEKTAESSTSSARA